jgi:hypothetical protein
MKRTIEKRASESKKPRRPLSNAERQARFRERRDARIRELEHRTSLRNEPDGPAVPPLRNVSLRNLVWTDETIDDALIKLRQHGDRLTDEYVKLLTTPGLIEAETKTVLTSFLKWRQLFAAKVKATSRRRVLKVGA